MTEFHHTTNNRSPVEFERPVVSVRRPVVEELFTNPPEEFAEQVEAHSACLPAIQQVSEELMKSGVDLPDAIYNGNIPLATARELYTSLAYLLEDPDYQRIALYIPFDFLQKPPDSEEIDSAYELFVDNYKYAWWQLLSYRDKRADFTDGNLPDNRETPIEMVVKAAHLIPKLLELEIITYDELEGLIEQSKNDAILQQSIHDALNIQQDDRWSYVRTDTLELPAETGGATLLYEQEVQNILEREGSILPSRVNWLRTVIREQFIESMSQKLANAENYFELLTRLSGGDSLDIQITLASCEHLLHQELTPKSMVRTYEYALRSDDENVRVQAVLSLQRLCRASLVPREMLEVHGITLPSLAGKLSENISHETTDRLVEQTRKIESNPMLGKFLYPVLLVGGSSLKGYAAPDSDVDVSVFIKPNTPRDLQPQLREELVKILGTDAIEFWLDNDGDNLRIKDFEKFDFHEADSEWTHLLMQSIWVGDSQAISELQHKILPRYYEDNGSLNRYRYLLRIEQDILQYRLLQKGFARAHARDFDNHDDMPDGHSTFWDRGFRLLATRLFAEKVFLPKK